MVLPLEPRRSSQAQPQRKKVQMSSDEPHLTLVWQEQSILSREASNQETSVCQQPKDRTQQVQGVGSLG